MVGVVVLLVGVPLALGAIVGWYGVNPPATEGYSPVGSDAHALLNSFPASSLVVEIDYQMGWAPPAGAVNTLLDRIHETCQKGSVSVVQFGFNSSQRSFSEPDLSALEQSVRHTWPSFSTMSLDYLFLDGSDGDSASTIGLAFHGSSIAVFAGAIMSAAPSEYEALITTVMVHEFGHELGLVGLVGSAPNMDPNHPYHSNDPSDVMYWQVDSTAIFGLIGQAPPTQFGSADLQDLNTVRATPVIGELLPWVVLGILGGAAVGILVFDLRRRRLTP